MCASPAPARARSAHVSWGVSSRALPPPGHWGPRGRRQECPVVPAAAVAASAARTWWTWLSSHMPVLVVLLLAAPQCCPPQPLTAGAHGGICSEHTVPASTVGVGHSKGAWREAPPAPCGAGAAMADALVPTATAAHCCSLLLVAGWHPGPSLPVGEVRPPAQPTQERPPLARPYKGGGGLPPPRHSKTPHQNEVRSVGLGMCPEHPREGETRTRWGGVVV